MKIKIVSLVHIFLVFMLSSLVGIPFMTATAYASAEDSNPLRSDVNGDGIVNISDVATVSIAWVSQVGHQNWDPRADLDNDGEVNVSDMVLVTKDFGMTWLRYDFNGPLD